MSSTADGIIDKPGNHSVDETAEKLQAILRAKGIALFALVDHSGEAAKAGMKMRSTKLLIFGNPKAGTPLMQASPSIAIDLPLKILIWEDAAGKSGSHTTALRICESGTICRRNWSAISPSWKRWQPRLRNNFDPCTRGSQN